MTWEQGGESSRPDILDRVIDVFVVAFASWTILANVLVAAGRSFEDLVLATPAVPIVTWIVLRWLWRARHSSRPSCDSPPEPFETHLIVLGIAWAAAGVYLFTAIEEVSLLWIWVVILLAAVYLRTAPSDPPPARPQETRGLVPAVTVVLLAALAAAIALASHRPDADDSFYLNLVVEALDHPEAPLFAADGLHGAEGRPFLAAYYKVHSFELLVVLVARATAFEPAAVLYFILPPIFAALGVIARWLLVRRFGIGVAVVALLVDFVVLLAWGDGHRTYGNFGLVRIFQGKAILTFVLVPLILHFALRRAASGRASDGWRLGLANVAAVGMSSTALIVAPMITGLALLAASVSPLRSLSTALVTTAYPLILGSIIAVSTTNPEAVQGTAFWTTERGLVFVFGHGWRAALAGFALMTAPLVVADAWLRRSLAGYLLLFALIVLSPWWPELVDVALPLNIVWRAWWAVPASLIAGLTVGSVLAAPDVRLRWAGGIVAVVLIVAFALVPGRWTVAATNHTELGWPRLKVPPEYEIAEQIVKATGPDAHILAPEVVATWIPTFRRHPSSIVTRDLYLRPVFGSAEAEARRRLSACATVGEECEGFLVDLQRRGVDMVVLPASNPRAEELGKDLAGVGFRHRHLEGYDAWRLAMPEERDLEADRGDEATESHHAEEPPRAEVAYEGEDDAERPVGVGEEVRGDAGLVVLALPPDGDRYLHDPHPTGREGEKPLLGVGEAAEDHEPENRLPRRC